MKPILLSLAIAILLSACATMTTTDVTLADVQSTLQNIQKSLHIGQTTLDEMKELFGTPSEIKEDTDSILVKWTTSYTVSRTIGSQPVTLESFDPSSPSGNYKHHATRTSILDAQFDKEGILTNYSLQ